MGELVIWIVLSVAVAAYAGSKGRSGAGFFFLSLLLSPLIGFIWVAVGASNPQAIGLRKCPQCAEWVRGEALKCRFCSHDFYSAAAASSPAVIAPLQEGKPPGESSSEPSLKWLGIAGLIAVFALLVFWSIRFWPAAVPGSVHSVSASEDSAIAAMRGASTACIVYASSFSHGYPAKLQYLGPSVTGKNSELGFGLIDADLASGAKADYLFQYTPGKRVRGVVKSFTLIARPSSGSGRSFYVDESGVVRSSAAGDPDKFSSPV
ncbi:MAG TPA: hypothetical protein VKQ28_14705 [Candidatus Acidoferrum sp.]|nr:hypothetical protein [Candidatus Acidoferrum sp.]